MFSTKPKTEKLLKYTPKDGTTYGYDEYAVILTLGKAISKELESEERHIRNGCELLSYLHMLPNIAHIPVSS